MNRTREEQETIIRFDETDAEAFLWTTAPRQASRWRKAGYPVVAQAGGWAARVPKRLVMRGRRLVSGQESVQKARGNPAALQIYRVAQQKSRLPASEPSSAPDSLERAVEGLGAESR
jgi:hypothetical protein